MPLQTQSSRSSPKRSPYTAIPRRLLSSAWLWLCVAFLSAAGCAAPQSPSGQLLEVVTSTPPAGETALVTSMESLDDKHRLAIGDRLSFRIVEDQEDPKPILVTDSGDVELPYIGRFPALDKTCKQLATELKVELEKEYYIKATVIVAVDARTRSRGKVYLVGQLRLAGPQEIPSDETFTLSKAILRAGGFGEFADKKHVKVTRQINGSTSSTTTFVINVAEVLEKGKADKDLTLESGDLIFVPSRLLNL